MSNIDVHLPAGQWINYLNEQQVYTGPTTVHLDIPLGREPTFIASGAIIPMQVRDGSTGHGTPASAGALTVNVFPKGHSTLSYFDANSQWLMFDAQQTGSSLTLYTSWAPSQPVIYRIARWPGAPKQPQKSFEYTSPFMSGCLPRTNLTFVWSSAYRARYSFQGTAVTLPELSPF